VLCYLQYVYSPPLALLSFRPFFPLLPFHFHDVSCLGSISSNPPSPLFQQQIIVPPPPTFSAPYPILLTSHLGLLNYRWAHAGLSDSLDAGIASLISVLCFGAGGYYAKSGDNGGGVLLVVAGVLQGWAGRSGL
jgi:hypothetical protein